MEHGISTAHMTRTVERILNAWIVGKGVSREHEPERDIPVAGSTGLPQHFRSLQLAYQRALVAGDSYGLRILDSYAYDCRACVEPVCMVKPQALYNWPKGSIRIPGSRTHFSPNFFRNEIRSEVKLSSVCAAISSHQDTRHLAIP